MMSVVPALSVCSSASLGLIRFGTRKIVLIPDHYIFTADERANRNVDILREFAKEQGIKYLRHHRPSEL